jgi:hypothetical protein
MLGCREMAAHLQGTIERQANVLSNAVERRAIA